jgi:catechol 2,3-dioxygenase-like lactoylglutathione lyase family enzyme
MDFGWCDICLRVKDVERSREFYEGLGFHRVEGNDVAGWAIVVHEAVRVGLYEKKHMGDDPVMLNFRGGDVLAIAKELQSRGFAFDVPPKAGPEGGGSATLRDPDGYAIFFDTAPGETRKD